MYLSVVKALNLSLSGYLALGAVRSAMEVYYILSMVFNELKDAPRREKASRSFHVAEKMLQRFATNKRCAQLRMDYK